MAALGHIPGGVDSIFGKLVLLAVQITMPTLANPRYQKIALAKEKAHLKPASTPATSPVVKTRHD